MGDKRQILTALLAAGLIAALAAGCGGGGSSSSTEVISAFINPGGENKIPRFGHEASDAEREAASKVLEENLQARATRHFADQCLSLSATVVKELKKFAKQGGIGNSCASFLEYEVRSVEEIEEVPVQAVIANTMTGPIDALRVEGNEAYALYHGTHGKDYSIEMKKEGGKWKVASLSAQKP